jgi:hypothetical protein
MRVFLIILVIFQLLGCSSYPADEALTITKSFTKLDVLGDKKTVINSIKDIYKAMSLPNDRFPHIGNPEDYELQKENGDLKTNCQKKVIAVSSGKIDAKLCINSILIASGDVEIAHSSGNIIIATGNVKISFDGKLDGGGSVIISKKHVEIIYAYGSTIYAVNGLALANASEVVSYNTADRVYVQHINNIEIKSLFSNEKDGL